MSKPKRPATKPSMTLAGLLDRFPDESACKAFLASKRWPNGAVACPRCGNVKVATLKARPFHWQCKGCAKNGYRFSVIAGTIFENTNAPLRTWFQVAFLMVTAKKSISAMQVQRTLGIKSYETAWYMCHRIRAAMQNEDFMKLTGVVEVDETYIGGKAKNRHGGGTGGGRGKNQGRGPTGKTAVVGAIARKGNVVCRVIERTDRATLDSFVRRTVADDVSLVATDDHSGYDHLSKTMPHEAVAHSRKEYVRGEVHTGTIDGFWSLIKRGIMGSFHHVSTEYLPLYLNEFAFRNNQRENPDMFGLILERA